MREPCPPAARAPAHETFLRVAVQTNKARLALRVIRTFLDGVRDGLIVLLVGVVWFGAAAACYSSAYLPVAAAAPVVALAAVAAVSSGACGALHGVVGLVRQWRGAGGTECEDHLALDA